MMNLLDNFIALFAESAPWLLLGLLVAGLMRWMVPLALLKRHLGGRGIGAIVKAALIGAPLPLCSCGVIPAAIGLRRAGASKPATISFLVSTPETGVDSISVSYALLGPFIALIRPLAAIFSAIFAGLMVMFATTRENQAGPGSNDEKSKSTDCCGHHPKTSHTHDIAPLSREISLSGRIVESLKFSGGQLLRDISNWLLIGLLLAAMIKTWVSTDFLVQWGDGFVAMLVMALVGVPMYICATASTPIAAGFLAVGVSPGAVLVFMLAGPATNLSTIGMIRQEMGSRVLVAYLTSILFVSIAAGYLVNWLIKVFSFEIYKVAAQAHHIHESTFAQACALLLGGLMLLNYLRPVVSKLNKPIFKES